jgi:hypothetical protein
MFTSVTQWTTVLLVLHILTEFPVSIFRLYVHVVKYHKLNPATSGNVHADQCLRTCHHYQHLDHN